MSKEPEATARDAEQSKEGVSGPGPAPPDMAPVETALEQSTAPMTMPAAREAAEPSANSQADSSEPRQPSPSQPDSDPLRGPGPAMINPDAPANRRARTRMTLRIPDDNVPISRSPSSPDLEMHAAPRMTSSPDLEAMAGPAAMIRAMRIIAVGETPPAREPDLSPVPTRVMTNDAPSTGAVVAIPAPGRAAGSSDEPSSEALTPEDIVMEALAGGAAQTSPAALESPPIARTDESEANKNWSAPVSGVVPVPPAKSGQIRTPLATPEDEVELSDEEITPDTGGEMTVEASREVAPAPLLPPPRRPSASTPPPPPVLHSLAHPEAAITVQLPTVRAPEPPPEPGVPRESQPSFDVPVEIDVDVSDTALASSEPTGPAPEQASAQPLALPIDLPPPRRPSMNSPALDLPPPPPSLLSTKSAGGTSPLPGEVAPLPALGLPPPPTTQALPAAPATLGLATAPPPAAGQHLSQPPPAVAALPPAPDHLSQPPPAVAALSTTPQPAPVQATIVTPPASAVLPIEPGPPIVAEAAQQASASDPDEVADVELVEETKPSEEPKRAPPPPTPPPLSKPSATRPKVEPPPAVSPGQALGSSPATRPRVRPWWEELFTDDFVRSMDKLTPDQVKREVKFIEESLAVQKGGVMLDLGCGAGQNAVELAARGYSVVGYDLSLTMLALAADEAQARGQKLNFLQGDMREMAFEEMFDGVFSWSTSFGYFDHDKNCDVIRRVQRALRTGGMFLLDIVNRDYLISRTPTMGWFEGDGCVCMDEAKFDSISSRLLVKRTLMLDDGRSREIEFSIRLYSLHEIGKMVNDAGFKVVEVSGHPAMAGVFMGAESPRLITLAEKR